MRDDGLPGPVETCVACGKDGIRRLGVAQYTTPGTVPVCLVCYTRSMRDPDLDRQLRTMLAPTHPRAKDTT